MGPLLCFVLVACTSSPTEIPRAKSDPGEIVYYTTHPEPEKVDKFCGAHDRSYVVKPVDVPEGDLGVLKRALTALFREQWGAAEEIGPVTVDQGRAIVDLRSTDGIGFASTICGGVAFLGSVLRTIFQFGSIDEAQIRLKGSCRRFGEFMQSLMCDTFTRDDL